MKKPFHTLLLLGAAAARLVRADETAAEKLGLNQRDAVVPPQAYETALQMEGMAQCRATVNWLAPCSACLTTTDGKVFYIGSPRAEGKVSAFRRILEEGQTYVLPDYFLEFQKVHQ